MCVRCRARRTFILGFFVSGLGLWYYLNIGFWETNESSSRIIGSRVVGDSVGVEEEDAEEDDAEEE